MILTGNEIVKQRKKGNIVIDPFDPHHLSPNSYDVTLSNQLLTYKCLNLDVRKENPTKKIKIPDCGMCFLPGIIYLGSTNESTVSTKYIPMYEGRSSIGRLGIFTHVTAGFGDIGWGFVKQDRKLVCTKPTWTLEIVVVQPIWIVPNIRIGQVYFMQPKGKISLYVGKYNYQKQPESLGWKDFA